MSIEFPSDLESFVNQRVESGAYGNHGDVIRAAFSLLKERERLVQAIEAGFAQIRDGQFTEYSAGAVSSFVANIRKKSAEIQAARAQ